MSWSFPAGAGPACIRAPGRAATFLSAPRPLELRIDVDFPPATVEAELERVQARLRRFGGVLCGLRPADLPLPGFACRFREADGEQYVYVEDLANGRLAAYTVFNRLVELDRHADRHLRAPHSKVGRMYQRRGIASAVYRWALARGICLITGARQSPGAHALWHSLAGSHALRYVALRDRQMSDLGAELAPERLEDFHTRMVLLAAGWDAERFLSATRARRATCAEADAAQAATA